MGLDILALPGWWRWAFNRNAVHRNRRKKDEDEALYREIAAYCRERKKGTDGVA